MSDTATSKLASNVSTEMLLLDAIQTEELQSNNDYVSEFNLKDCAKEQHESS